MDRVLERTPEGTSPRTFALNHLRPKSSFVGCSRISEYELMGKLGEGTFGYVCARARTRLLPETFLGVADSRRVCSDNITQRELCTGLTSFALRTKQ
jgi:hypothetical protein